MEAIMFFFLSSRRRHTRLRTVTGVQTCALPICILRDALPTVERAPIVLFYSNPRPQDAAVLGELQALAAKTERLILIATMTKIEGSSIAWRGETGRITPQLLDRHTRKLAAPIYYVVGPPAMVGGIREMLASLGIRESDVRSEEFFGY